MTTPFILRVAARDRLEKVSDLLVDLRRAIDNKRVQKKIGTITETKVTSQKHVTRITSDRIG